ncbi:MAG TPA: energy transducer TonB [Methyloradius sp.]
MASESQAVSEKLRLDSNSLRDFKSLKPRVISSVTDKPRASWPSLVLVIAMHVGILILAVHAQQKDQSELPAITPMMVSLLDAPQPESRPAVEPEKTEVPKVEPVKQKPVLEKKSVIDTPSPVQPVQDNSDKQDVTVTESKPSPSTEHVVESNIDKAPPKEDIVEPPKFGVAYLNNPAPNYPGMSRRTGEQGQVMLRVLVSVTGEATSVELEKTSQYERLDQAALEAVKKWRFVPAKKNNQPLSAYVLVPVRFSLDK